MSNAHEELKELDSLFEHLSIRYPGKVKKRFQDNSIEDLLHLRHLTSDENGFRFTHSSYLSYDDALKINECFERWKEDIDKLMFGMIVDLKDLEQRGLVALMGRFPNMQTLSDLNNIRYATVRSCVGFEQRLILLQLSKTDHLPKNVFNFSREIRALIELKRLSESTSIADIILIVDSLIHFPNRKLFDRVCELIPYHCLIDGLKWRWGVVYDSSYKCVDFIYHLIETFGPRIVPQCRSIPVMFEFDESRLPSVKKMTDLLYNAGKLPTDLAKLICSYLW